MMVIGSDTCFAAAVLQDFPVEIIFDVKLRPEGACGPKFHIEQKVKLWRLCSARQDIMAL